MYMHIFKDALIVQSLVTCLDRGDIVIQYAFMLGRAMHRNAFAS